jgi:hypothetical protein
MALADAAALWIHRETAWIIVDIGARDWCNLAYQFGHELMFSATVERKVLLTPRMRRRGGGE